jgi:hypothetical protein
MTSAYAWENGDETWVAEVKSITVLNEERQLRTALGQVLRYSSKTADRPVRAMIVAEREPTDPSWAALCAEQDVSLRWPPDGLLIE